MKKWSLKGFEAISKGSFGNAGQNLYVSKKGVLQRIWQFDVNSDGYVDILVANSHGYNEHPYAAIISDPAGTPVIQNVLTQDGQAGQVADINGNGYDDLIIATANNGHHNDVTSYVYFGGSDGITENRKIDLAARSCTCTTVADIDGDGKKEILYLIDTAAECNSSAMRYIRVYHQDDYGIRMNGFRDYPAVLNAGKPGETDRISWFIAADIDHDGCEDLYCRTEKGKWLILWGSSDGFSVTDATELFTATDDGKRFDLLEFGGGNVRYYEFTRPKVLLLGGKEYLFYADRETVKLVRFNGRIPGETVELIIPNIVTAAAGHVFGKQTEDLVMIQMNSLHDQHVLFFKGGSDRAVPELSFPVMTPRDIVLWDFSGNGHDDIVIVQGRNETAFTSESLLFMTDENGKVCPEPRRFVTHNCAEAFVGDFNRSGKKSLVFINQQESTSYGHVPVYVYLGSENGFDPGRRLEFPGHSAGTMLPVDFNDDGNTDILVLHNSEDQPQYAPPGDLYWGDKDGSFRLDRVTRLPAPLAWGGHCADLNKDGYLDIIATCLDHIRIYYGSENGYSEDNMVILHPGFENPEKDKMGASWPALADLNGNGWLDMVIPMSSCSYSLIYWGGPEGFSDERRTKLPMENALIARIADLNHNGYPDIVMGSRVSKIKNVDHEGNVAIFWGGPDGYSGYNCCMVPSYQANSLTLADFTGDGWIDIFVSSYFNARERDVDSFIYWNDHGNFSVTNRKRMFSHSSSGAWACDFNEDGYMDLFLSHHRAYGNHNTESAIWWNGPEGFKEENRSWLPTIGPHDLVPNDCGDVMLRRPEETYITPAAYAGDLHSIGWTAELMKKTWVNCQIRTAKTEEELESAEFVGRDGTGATRLECGEEIPAELIKGGYFQIRLFIGAVNSGNTPRITEIYAE